MAFNEIGRKIYYDKVTGNVLANTSELAGWDVRATTLEEDMLVYPVLHDRDPSTIGVIELEYGQFGHEFGRYRYRVDPVEGVLVWDTSVDLAIGTLEQVKTAKIEQLEDFCNRAIASGFRSSALGAEHTYPSDPAAQNNLQIVLKRLEIGEKQMAGVMTEETRPTFPYQTLDAGYLDHTLPQLEQVFADGVDESTIHVMHFRHLKTLVEKAKTAAEVDAIQW